MRRYQELFDLRIIPELQLVIGALQQNSLVLADSALTKCNALNMLNTRYLIYNPESMPLINKNALGNAWFVSDIKWVENADDEIAKVATIDPSREAVIDTEFAGSLDDFTAIPDSGSSSIELTSYAPNKLVYESRSDIDQLAIFSEIYYPKGWKAKIDGEPVSHFRANFVLRALLVPKGIHTIEFEFHPASYFTGEKIAMASSIVLLLLFLGVISKEITGLFKQKDQ